jgi:predicted nucleotidyltransferase
MRLSPEQIHAIRTGVAQVAGRDARVWLFGSRVHDQERGGDVDLLLELNVPVREPAQLAARLSARVSRAMYGRKVDVVVKAPNLMHLPIHTIALQEGIRL